MKTKILTLFLALFTMLARGSSVDLAWIPSCSPDLVGYKIYYGLVTNTIPTIYTQFAFCLQTNEIVARFSGSFSNVITVPITTTNYSITNLSGGLTYFFAVTAYDNDSEGDFSGEAIYTTPIDLNTNAGSWGGSWGGRTNWLVYNATNGVKPSLAFAPYAYDIQWIVPPQVVTNCRVTYVTNNSLITSVTNRWLGTNYFSSKVRNYLLQSDMIIPTNWTIQTSGDLLRWTNSFSGSNSPVYNTVINQGGNKFFRLKF